MADTLLKILEPRAIPDTLEGLRVIPDTLEGLRVIPDLTGGVRTAPSEELEVFSPPKKRKEERETAGFWDSFFDAAVTLKSLSTAFGYTEEDPTTRDAIRNSLSSDKDRTTFDEAMSSPGGFFNWAKQLLGSSAGMFSVGMVGGSAAKRTALLLASRLPFAAAVANPIGIITTAGLLAAQHLTMGFGRQAEANQQRVDKGEMPVDVSFSKAIAAAGGQTALDLLGIGLFFKPLGRLIGLAGTAAAKETTDSILQAAGKGAVGGAAFELPTEVTQTVLDRWQASLPLDGPEANKEYLETAVGGAILGTSIGSLSRVVNNVQQKNAYTSEENVKALTDNQIELFKDQDAPIIPTDQPDIPTILPAKETTQNVDNIVKKAAAARDKGEIYTPTPEETQILRDYPEERETAINKNAVSTTRVYDPSGRIYDAKIVDSANPEAVRIQDPVSFQSTDTVILDKSLYSNTNNVVSPDYKLQTIKDNPSVSSIQSNELATILKNIEQQQTEPTTPVLFDTEAIKLEQKRRINYAKGMPLLEEVRQDILTGNTTLTTPKELQKEYNIKELSDAKELHATLKTEKALKEPKEFTNEQLTRLRPDPSGKGVEMPDVSRRAIEGAGEPIPRGVEVPKGDVAGTSFGADRIDPSLAEFRKLADAMDRYAKAKEENVLKDRRSASNEINDALNSLAALKVPNWERNTIKTNKNRIEATNSKKLVRMADKLRSEDASKELAGSDLKPLEAIDYMAKLDEGFNKTSSKSKEDVFDPATFKEGRFGETKGFFGDMFRHIKYGLVDVKKLEEFVEKKFPVFKEVSQPMDRFEGAVKGNIQDAMPVLTLLDKVMSENVGAKADPMRRVVLGSSHYNINMLDAKPENYTKEQRVVYDRLKKDWNAIGKEGQNAYRLIKNYGDVVYNRLLGTLKSRLANMRFEGKEEVIKRFNALLKTRAPLNFYWSFKRSGPYWVSFTYKNEIFRRAFSSKAKSQTVVNQLNATPGVSEVELFKGPSKLLDRDREKISKTGFGEILKILDKNRTEIDPATIEDLHSMYLSMVPESSALHALTKRRENVLGYSTNLVEDFANTMMSNSRQLAKLEYFPQIQEGLDTIETALRTEYTGKDQIELRDLKEALEKHYEGIRNPNIKAIAQGAGKVGFVWYLSAPASFIVNLFQMPSVTYAYLASQFGPAKAAKELTKAAALFTSQAGSVRKSKKFKYRGETVTELVPSGLSKKEEVLYVKALREGVLDRTQIGDVTGTLDTVTPASKSSAGKIVNVMAKGFASTETFNREVSFIAGIRLAEANKAKLHKEQTPYTLAKYVVDSTHGDYSYTNAGLWFKNPAGRTALMFKKFPVFMHLNYLVQFKRVLSSKDYTKAEKIEAAKKIAYMMVIGLTMAGLKYTPLYFLVVGLIDILMNTFVMDDKEIWDTQNAVEQAIDDIFSSDEKDGGRLMGTIKGVITRGLPETLTGFSFAPRLGLGEAPYRIPYGMEDESLVSTTLFMLGGPIAALMNNVLKGGAEVAIGLSDGNTKEIWRGVEKMLPAPFRAMVRQARTSETFGEGAVYDRYGNYIRSKPSAFETVGRLLGFSDASSVDAFMGQRLYTDREDEVLDQKKKLTNQLIGALIPQFEITDKRIDTIINDISKHNAKWGKVKAYQITTEKLNRSFIKKIRGDLERRAMDSAGFGGYPPGMSLGKIFTLSDPAQKEKITKQLEEYYKSNLPK